MKPKISKQLPLPFSGINKVPKNKSYVRFLESRGVKLKVYTRFPSKFCNVPTNYYFILIRKKVFVEYSKEKNE